MKLPHAVYVSGHGLALRLGDLRKMGIVPSVRVQIIFHLNMRERKITGRSIGSILKLRHELMNASIAESLAMALHIC